MNISAMRGHLASVERSAAFVVGGGPSLRDLAADTLRQMHTDVPASRFAMNLAGRGEDGAGWLVRPTHWCGYDPTVRFMRSTFLDPSIQKWVRTGRLNDLVPETTLKVRDCPNVLGYDMEYRTFDNFIYPTAEKVNDSLDSLVLCIDIAYLLGFRELFLIGTDMRIKPSDAQIALAESHGVSYPVTYEGRTSDRLKHFIQAYAKARSISESAACKEMEGVERESQYAFPETKSFGAAVACDTHYWERVEYLRLSRKTFAQAGLSITSCTPGSRLNTWFPYRSPEQVCDYLLERHGDPRKESTSGKYTAKQEHLLPWHKDIAPHFRKEMPKPKEPLAPKVNALKAKEVAG